MFWVYQFWISDVWIYRFIFILANSITDEGLEILLENITKQSLNILQEFYLCDNMLSEKGMSYLLDKCKSHKPLSITIHLSGNVLERVDEELYNRILEFDKCCIYNNLSITIDIDKEKIVEISDDISIIKALEVSNITFSFKLIKVVVDLYRTSNMEKYIYLLFKVFSNCEFIFPNTKNLLLSQFNEDEDNFNVLKGTNEKYKVSYEKMNQTSTLLLIRCMKVIENLSYFIYENTTIDTNTFSMMLNELSHYYRIKHLILRSINL